MIRFLNGDETAISRYFDRNRERKGYRALSEGMMALASGEPRLALTRAQTAERLLGKPELTTLLVAQAAEAAGDRKRATEAYKTLLSDDKTRFVGVRGLMQQKLAEGDRETALKLAEKAFELRPKHAETQDVLLKLQSDAGDWSGARATLGAKLQGRDAAQGRLSPPRCRAGPATGQDGDGRRRQHRSARSRDRGQQAVARPDPCRRHGRARLYREGRQARTRPAS